MKRRFIDFLPASLVSFIAALISLVLFVLSYTYYGLFVLIPGILAVPLYATFYFYPADLTKKVSITVILTVLRFLILLIGILLPTVLYLCLETVREGVTAFSLFISPSIFLLVYLLVAINSAIKAKRQKV